MTRLRVTPDETHILSLGTSKGGCVSPHRIYHCAQAFLQVPDCSTGSQLPFGAASAAFPISGCSQSIRRNEHPYPNHNLVRVPRAYDDQSIHAYDDESIHAQTIISFVFPEPTTTIEHPCPNHNLVRVPRAYDDQSIHAQTIISCVFQEHTLTRASMPKP